MLFRSGEYKNGDREGKWIFYYETGGLYQENNYKFGKLAGEIKTWGESQKLVSVGHYSIARPNEKSEWVSLKNGEWVFYDEKGNVIRKENYKSGVKQ